MLVSELRDDCLPSPPKKPAIFLYEGPFCVPAFDIELWLLEAVSLAMEGSRS